MELNEAMSGLLLTILTAAVTAIARAVQVYLRQLETKAQQEVGAGRWAWGRELAEVVVRSVEQYRKLYDWDNDQAKQFAVRELTGALHSAGISLTTQQVDALVEAALNAVREGQAVPYGHTLDGKAAIEPLPEVG